MGSGGRKGVETDGGSCDGMREGKGENHPLIYLSLIVIVNDERMRGLYTPKSSEA